MHYARTEGVRTSARVFGRAFNAARQHGRRVMAERRAAPLQTLEDAQQEKNAPTLLSTQVYKHTEQNERGFANFFTFL